MKRAIIGLAALVVSSCPLVASSCLQPNERIIELMEDSCNNITDRSRVGGGNYDKQANDKNLPPYQIALLGKIIDEKTDCRISMYVNIAPTRYYGKPFSDRLYVIQKKNSKIVTSLADDQRYIRIYPLVK